MLFYTGAIQHGAIQNNPSKSLGGYISQTQVPNDLENNIFSNIGFDTIQNNLKELRVLAFLNNTGAEINEFSFYVNFDDESFAKIKAGLVLNAIDHNCNVPYFEQISNENSTPFYVELKDCKGENNTLILNNIPANNYIGIFLQRELIKENNSDMDESDNNDSCQKFFDEFALEKAAHENPSIVLPKKRKEDKFDLVIQLT